MSLRANSIALTMNWTLRWPRPAPGRQRPPARRAPILWAAEVKTISRLELRVLYPLMRLTVAFGSAYNV